MRALLPILASLALLAACQTPAEPPLGPVPSITPGPPAPVGLGPAATPTPGGTPTPMTEGKRADASIPTPAVPSPTPAPNTRKLAAIGASDVVGLGADSPGTEAWPPVLAKLLGERTGQPIALSKFGFLGRTAPDLRKFEVPKAIAARPDFVVLWTGANDVRVGMRVEDFRPALDGILDDLEPTRAKVFVINLPHLDRLPFFAEYKDDYRRVMPAWQAAIRDSAQAHGATAIDLARFSDELDANPGYLWADGFHPSTRGYARLAAIVADAMEPAVAAAAR